MFGLGIGEVLFIFVLALIIIGPKQLPEVAKQAAKLINEIKRTANSFADDFRQASADADYQKQIKPKETLTETTQPVKEKFPTIEEKLPTISDKKSES